MLTKIYPTQEASMNILIADDDADSRTLLEVLLQKMGYSVITAHDGTEALDKMQSPGSPALVLLDWMMPGMEGIEVCRRYREQCREEPKYIILLTAKDTIDSIVDGLAAGANDYISKPFNKRELFARLNVGRRFIELQQKLADHITELKDSLEHVKKLQGILPICMYCHNIRNDQESWERIDNYIADHSDAEFSHGICPECFAKHHSSA
jgi:phosphoserine phosphatase RsbU/P